MPAKAGIQARGPRNPTVSLFLNSLEWRGRCSTSPGDVRDAEGIALGGPDYADPSYRRRHHPCFFSAGTGSSAPTTIGATAGAGSGSFAATGTASASCTVPGGESAALSGGRENSAGPGLTSGTGSITCPSSTVGSDEYWKLHLFQRMGDFQCLPPERISRRRAEVNRRQVGLVRPGCGDIRQLIGTGAPLAPSPVPGDN